MLKIAHQAQNILYICDDQTMFYNTLRAGLIGFAPLVDITNRAESPPPPALCSQSIVITLYDEQNMPLFSW